MGLVFSIFNLGVRKKYLLARIWLYLDLSGNIYLLISCCLEKGLPGIVIVIVPSFYGFMDHYRHAMEWPQGAFTNYVDKTKLVDGMYWKYQRYAGFSL